MEAFPCAPAVLEAVEDVVGLNPRRWVAIRYPCQHLPSNLHKAYPTEVTIPFGISTVVFQVNSSAR